MHRSEGCAGFTLLEIMIVVTILAILSSMGVPLYQSALRTARIQRAKQDLRAISMAVTKYLTENAGYNLPETLADVGYGDRLDPWGNRYMYLNFQTGGGSGMDFAIREGLVDPAALPPPSGGGNPMGRSAPSAPTPQGVTNRLTGRDLSTHIEPAPEVKQRVDQIKRKDRFLFPLNSDFDLFSLGPNRSMAPSISDPLSLDDVIRADNGSFFGLASEY